MSPVFDTDTESTVDPFGLLPDADYLVTVEDITFAQTRGGRDMVTVNFVIDGGDYQGRQLPYFLFVDDQPNAKVSYKVFWKRFKEALELPVSGSFDSDEKTIGGERVIGRSCFARTKWDSDNERPRITRLIPESKVGDESHNF